MRSWNRVNHRFTLKPLVESPARTRLHRHRTKVGSPANPMHNRGEDAEHALPLNTAAPAAVIVPAPDIAKKRQQAKADHHV